MIVVDAFGRDAVRDAIAEMLARQQETASALTEYARTHAPPDLEDAPFLGSWIVARTSVPCLAGLVENHPLLKGPAVVTSPLLLLSPSGGWARTESRWYRLGSRAGGLQ